MIGIRIAERDSEQDSSIVGNSEMLSDGRRMACQGRLRDGRHPMTLSREQEALANIGSLFGIGFPTWTGGVVQYINGYPGGLQGFVDRARQLAERYGDHFSPPESLVARAAAGETLG